MKTNQPTPQDQMMRFIIGNWIRKPIHAAAELGIADLLSKGDKNIEELAKATGTHTPSLYRMMRALASIGIFQETADQRFDLTPMAECLRTGALRSIALLFNSDWSDRSWSLFLDGVKKGITPFEEAHGLALNDWLEQNPAAAKVFNEANAIKAGNTHRVIVDFYDFAGIERLTDLGGGTGLLMAEILAAHPAMQGVIAERASVVPEAMKTIQSRGLAERCIVKECDFFRSVPAGSDAILLSNILHDWPDDRCRVILDRCGNALESGRKLLIMEMIVPEGNAPSVVKLLDLEMMVTTGGRERTREEFAALFTSAGFELSQVIPTGESVCVMEGIRL